MRRGNKRERTREKLLDAAARLFAERGIGAVSLDTVASEVGMTKGAIYGNFACKDDLIFAVINARTPRTLVRFDGDRHVRNQLQAILAEAFDHSETRRVRFALLAELDSYALGRPELAARFMASASKRHQESAMALASRAQELALEPLAFVLAVQGIIGGLLFQHACFPEVVTRNVVWQALEGLLVPPQ